MTEAIITSAASTKFQRFIANLKKKETRVGGLGQKTEIRGDILYGWSLSGIPSRFYILTNIHSALHSFLLLPE